jgi:hypothetical protein
MQATALDLVAPESVHHPVGNGVGEMDDALGIRRPLT